MHVVWKRCRDRLRQKYKEAAVSIHAAGHGFRLIAGSEKYVAARPALDGAAGILRNE